MVARWALESAAPATWCLHKKRCCALPCVADLILGHLQSDGLGVPIKCLLLLWAGDLCYVPSWLYATHPYR
jgi:hypothetical protein